MPPAEIVLLVAIGFLGGSLNAVVGGGTFFTFPVLLALGVPPVAANATNTVALWPGILMAAHAYWAELVSVRHQLPWRAAIAVAGGAAGALLLLASSNAFFLNLVPWLLGAATVLFAFSGAIVRRLNRLKAGANAALVAGMGILIAVYGGYFGAGIGILLMAALVLAGEADAQIANGQKNLLSALINGTAVVIFIGSGQVLWGYAFIVMAGSVAGGHLGARLARRISPARLRICVIAAGTIMSAVYFERVYFA